MILVALLVLITHQIMASPQPNVEPSTTELPLWGREQQVSERNFEDDYIFLEQLYLKAIDNITTQIEWDCFYKMELWRFNKPIFHRLMEQYGQVLTGKSTTATTTTQPKKRIGKRAFDRMDGMSFS